MTKLCRCTVGLGGTLVAPPTEETAGPEIERTKGVRHPKTCLLQKGGVSTWFPTCTGGEYNKYKSIWQETVQSEKPREADRGSRQRSWYRSPAEKKTDAATSEGGLGVNFLRA